MRTRSSVRKAVRKRNIDVRLPRNACSGMNSKRNAIPATAEIPI